MKSSLSKIITAYLAFSFFVWCNFLFIVPLLRELYIASDYLDLWNIYISVTVFLSCSLLAPVVFYFLGHNKSWIITYLTLSLFQLGSFFISIFLISFSGLKFSFTNLSTSSIFFLTFFIIFYIFLSVGNMFATLKSRNFLNQAGPQWKKWTDVFFITVLVVLFIGSIIFFKFVDRRPAFPFNYPDPTEDFFIQEYSFIQGGKVDESNQKIYENILSTLQKELSKNCTWELCDLKIFSRSWRDAFIHSEADQSQIDEKLSKFSDEQRKSYIKSVDIGVSEIEKFFNSFSWDTLSSILNLQQIIHLRNYFQCNKDFDVSCARLSLLNLEMSKKLIFFQGEGVIKNLAWLSMLNYELSFIGYVLSWSTMNNEAKNMYFSQLPEMLFNKESFEKMLWCNWNNKEYTTQKYLYINPDFTQLQNPVNDIWEQSIRALKNYYYDRCINFNTTPIEYKISVFRSHIFWQFMFMLADSAHGQALETVLGKPPESFVDLWVKYQKLRGIRE